MPSLRKSAEKRGFPQRLGKAYGFPTFPTDSATDFFIKKGLDGKTFIEGTQYGWK